MTKADFLACLRNELKNITTEEREEALKYYSEYFEDAGEENVQSVITQLGSPERLADTIRANCAGVPAVISDAKNAGGGARGAFNPSRTILIILLVIIASPLWISIAGAAIGLIGGAIAVVAAILLIGFAMVVSGVVAFIATLPMLAVNMPNGVFSAGICLVIIAIGTLLIGLVVFALGKGLPRLGRGIGKLSKKLFGRRRAK